MPFKQLNNPLLRIVDIDAESPLEKRKRKRKKSNEPRKTTKGKGRNFRTVKELVIKVPNKA